MTRALASVLVASLLLAGCGVAARHPASSQLVPIGEGVNGPPRLRATLYANGPPTLAALAFDPGGGLWATAAGLSEHRYDGVYLIAGGAKRALKVLTGLNEPLGLLWLKGRLYVASLGRVDAFGGFDGRRFHTHARVLNGPVAGGENNLLALAPDGRLLMGVTATCDHCSPKSRWSGSIVSFRPDGSDLRLYARRIRAPFGLAYFPGRNDLFVSMNQRDDLGARTPGDWLALVQAGGDWRFPDCYGQGGAACAGVPAPLAVLDKHAAAGGVAIVTGQLGAGVGTAALVAEWASGRLLQVPLTKVGSAYSGSPMPFLTGIKNPLALAITPERSLLVGDWTSGRILSVSSAEASTQGAK